MASSTIPGNTKAIAKRSKRVWRYILQALIQRRTNDAHVSSTLLPEAFAKFCRHHKKFSGFLKQNRLISTTTFEDVFNGLNDHACLSHFRFLRADFLRLVFILPQQTEPYLTKRNRYSSTPLLVTCLLLSHLAIPYRWSDRVTFFMKHSSQLSEIFWEGLEEFVDEYEHLITGGLHSPFIADRAEQYAQAVLERTNALENCVGFIDGTSIRIARPSDNGLQKVVYNGHKRFHALKFQAVVCPDGILLHGYGPVEGRRHDWTLYVRSELKAQLEMCLVVNEKQYCIYGDSAYNLRGYLQVPYQGAELNDDEKAFNLAMSTARVTVEWIVAV